ncbi:MULTISPECIES: hypothetical protein [unclassified Streptomyces]|uniref:hypothetical protein n=1 Tax=unclassified Streptomyces TaxID=2593676 RepID=UPI0025B62591|nr:MULTISPECIES: hypothetical protein [unclassified Streptomyces]MDN3251064.1 hypothetical protein [Streptomyces sp. ZSW22]MDN3254020.1 hypothetical protein [Streptomyces sp. MA25(2023)]
MLSHPAVEPVEVAVVQLPQTVQQFQGAFHAEACLALLTPLGLDEPQVRRRGRTADGVDPLIVLAVGDRRHGPRRREASEQLE